MSRARLLLIGLTIGTTLGASHATAADSEGDSPATAPVATEGALRLSGTPEVAPSQPAREDQFLVDFAFEDSGDVLTPVNAYDRHYTAGERLTVAFWPQWADDLAEVFPLHSQFETARDGTPIKPQTAAGFFVGQDIYTPAHSTDPSRQDAWPFAGFLYTGGFWQRASDFRLDHVELDVGITGPSSLASESQKAVHDAIGEADPVGWEHQLPGEVGFNLIVSRHWDFDLLSNQEGWGVDAIPEVQLTAGTMNRNAEGGGIIRAGWQMPHDFGPGRIHDQSAYTAHSRQTGFYFFVGGDGRGVQYDWALDGTEFRDTVHPGSLPWVAEADTGLMLDVGKHLHISYVWSVLTHQMRGQDGYDGYGGVHLTYVLSW
jgi:hypothetical protein